MSALHSLRQTTHARRAGLASVPAVIMLLLGGAVTANASTLATFSTHGTYKWTVPAGVYKVTFDVFGASGGYLSRGNLLVSVGGPGGEAKATFKVKPGEVFEIIVGGSGEASVDGNGGAWGFNGGGAGGTDGGGGGGASDVRLGGTGNLCATTMTCTLVDRVIVGGGGGGGGNQRDGGAGGGAAGGSGGTSAPGGQQEGAIFQPCYSWCLPDFGHGGQREASTDDVHYRQAAGGGGGWFGGDPGDDGVGDTLYANDGGGGGSGFIGRTALKGSFPGGTRTGDGLVVIKTA